MNNNKLTSVQSLKSKILDFLKTNEFTYVSPDIDTINHQDNKFTYLCKCKQEHTRSWNQIYRHEITKGKDYIPMCIKKANIDGKYWYFNESIKNTYIDKENNLIWKEDKAGWISNKGHTISKSKGSEMSIDKDTLYVSFNKSSFHLPTKMAELFQVEGWKEKCSDVINWIARFGKNNELSYDVENIVFVSKNVIASQNRSNSNNSILLGDENVDVTDVTYTKCTLTFLEGLTLFSNGWVWKKSTKEWLKGTKANDKVFLRYRLKGNDKKYLFEKIMIMAFDPKEDLTDYDDYDKYDVIHEDNDPYNNHIDNLRLISKKLKLTEKRKLKSEQGKQERIDHNHENLKRILNKKQGELLIPFESIKTVTDEFKYRCKCGEIKKTNLKNLIDIENSECRTCSIVEQLKHAQSSEVSYTDEYGEEFIKTDLCYISENGIIKTDLKKDPHKIRDKDNLVTIRNEKYNAKYLIAKAFKIKYYEYLDEEGFYVVSKDDTNNYSIYNIFVWASSIEKRKLLTDNKIFGQQLDKIRKEKTKNKDNKLIIKDYNNCEYRVLKEFPNCKFYEDGSIETYTGYRTFGYTAPNNYKIFTINNSSYHVHRLICFAFHPKDGLTKLSDYSCLQVNHKNIRKNDPSIINTLNNEINNLEWTTPSENAQHALNEGLCGYAKSVLQFSVDENKNKKEFIKCYPSVAEACRESRDSKDFIKNVANGISRPNFYLWEWAKKEEDKKEKIKQFSTKINDNSDDSDNDSENDSYTKNKKQTPIKSEVKPKIIKKQILKYEKSDSDED